MKVWERYVNGMTKERRVNDGNCYHINISQVVQELTRVGRWIFNLFWTKYLIIFLEEWILEELYQPAEHQLYPKLNKLLEPFKF